jgi:hypothetical protein
MQASSRENGGSGARAKWELIGLFLGLDLSKSCHQMQGRSLDSPGDPPQAPGRRGGEIVAVFV